jgi:hypothetical protein
VGCSTSHNPIGLHGLLRDIFFAFTLERKEWKVREKYEEEEMGNGLKLIMSITPTSL